MEHLATLYPRWSGELVRRHPDRPVPTPLHPARLHLGRVLITPGAAAVCSRDTVARLTLRHMCGDWGELDAEDREQNERALINGDRVLSSYPLSTGVVWVITEADRSATTILLPEEY